MRLKIKSQESFWSGVLFTCIGVIVIGVSRGYRMGSAMRMGPGYFPTYLGIVLSVLGAIITLTSFKIEGEKVEPFAWRGIVMLALGFLLFSWAIEHLGFVPAMFAIIFCSALAGKSFKLSEALIMCLVLIVGSIVVFIYGLKLPFPLFW